MDNLHLRYHKILPDSVLEEEDEMCLKNPNLNLTKQFMKHSLPFLPKIDEAKRPMAFKLINYILDHDFPIPKIQFLFYDTFGSPNPIEVKRMKRVNPDYDGRYFEPEEDAVVVQRFAKLLKANGFSAKDGWKAVKQITKLPKKGTYVGLYGVFH